MTLSWSDVLLALLFFTGTLTLTTNKIERQIYLLSCQGILIGVLVVFISKDGLEAGIPVRHAKASCKCGEECVGPVRGLPTVDTKRTDCGAACGQPDQDDCAARSAEQGPAREARCAHGRNFEGALLTRKWRG